MGVLAIIFLVIFLVLVIATLNLASSIHISLEQRQREFGTLYALGLSQKGLRKLLCLEGLIISFKSSLWSAVLGLGAGIGLYLYIYYVQVAKYMDFIFPLLPIIILCAAYVVIPAIVSLAASSRLTASSPAELLVQED